MYWLGDDSGFFVGLGPCGFGPAPRPLPFATYSFVPEGLRAMPDGYQPVGISPSTPSFALPTRTTATSLFPAFATYSLVPSSETASAFGFVPTLAPAYGTSEIV